jgi:hypothetical protein
MRQYIRYVIVSIAVATVAFQAPLRIVTQPIGTLRFGSPVEQDDAAVLD